MKYTIEQQLLESRHQDSKGNAPFVARAMAAIKAQGGYSAATNSLGADKRASTARHLLGVFKSLPVAVAVAIIIAAIAITGGCVYAAAHFVPGLITIVSKHASQRGTTEYVIPDFAACTHSTTQKFELNKDAPPLTDDDVKKIVQARCELDWANRFVAQTWPTYGSHRHWKDGDDIFYARLDVLGSLQSASTSKFTLTVNGNAKTYTRADKEAIVAYANGEKIALNILKSNDTIFAVVRVAETYHDHESALYSDHSIQYYGNNEPRTLGAIAALKLSLPIQYYGSMQQFITEIPPCDNNPGEYCPRTAFIDVFPRAGGEAATNSAYVTHPGNVLRTISGKVTELGAGTLSLKSSSGAVYTVAATADAFQDYNQHYSPDYKDFNAALQIGSTVFVTYSQAANANPRAISLKQIFSVGLQIDATSPKAKLGDIKQY